MAVSACKFWRKDPPPAPAAAAPSAPPLAGIDVHTEEQWIVSDTAAHIARWQGRTPGPPATLVEPRGATPAYQAKLGDRAVTLTLSDYLWAPANFAPLVAAPAAASTTTCDTPDFLKNLLTPTVRVLVETDDRLSKRLEQEPQNPCLHEAAAILIAVFQMRETAHTLDDPRPALNRMTAHLAIARVLRNGAAPGVEGRLAELLLRALAWRHDGFPEEIKGYAEKAAEPERTWLRVISLYAVQDWRELANPTKATLAERLSYLRALANKTSPNRVLAFLDEGVKEKIADWPRLAFQRDMSVEVCGTYGEVAPPAVWGEIAEVYRLTRGTSPSADQLTAALNEETPSATLRVLDWPLWAAFEQRNLVAAFRYQHNCLQRMYGLEDEATAYRRQIAAQFGTLRLAPLLFARIATNAADFKRAVADAVPLVKQHPDVVSYSNWVLVGTPFSHGSEPPPPELPGSGTWFEPLIPHGTALDYNIRFTSARQPPMELLEAAQSHVYHVLVRRLYAERKYGKKPPVSFLKSHYGATVLFDRDALASITDAARDTDATEFLSAARTMCEIEADDCQILAVYLKDHGDAEGAAREYQRWFDGARNRVAVSHDIDWLVDYYFDHGQKDKALAIARDAADTYSSYGLTTLARVLGRLKRYPEAEEYFRKEKERYGGMGSYTEYVAMLISDPHDPSLKRTLDTLLTSTFPEGQQPVSKDELGATRPDGAAIGSLPHGGGQCGLAIGDVVVGIDGVRVKNLRQIRLQNRLSMDKDLKVLYWRQGNVVEASVPRKAFRDYGYR
jgi:hypothetical protein